MTMLIMAAWCGELLDVKGAFLHGKFEWENQMFMEILEGFEKFCQVGWHVRGEPKGNMSHEEMGVENGSISMIVEMSGYAVTSVV